ncbi:MAG: DNA-binding protein [Desulfobacteraceae bacterium]|nr:MAG: DNA-binding protein [Desulfobacteraceae bacterium]
MVTTTIDSLQYFHLRLGPGEDLFQSLRSFLDEQGLTQAFLLSTIGSLRRVVVNFPEALVDNPKVGSIVLEGPFEINGISGEVWREDKDIRVHLHGTVTRRGGELYGGGLGDGALVLKLAEMVIAGVKKIEMKKR